MGALCCTPVFRFPLRPSCCTCAGSVCSSHGASGELPCSSARIAAARVVSIPSLGTSQVHTSLAEYPPHFAQVLIWLIQRENVPQPWQSFCARLLKNNESGSATLLWTRHRYILTWDDGALGTCACFISGASISCVLSIQATGFPLSLYKVTCRLGGTGIVPKTITPWAAPDASFDAFDCSLTACTG